MKYKKFNKLLIISTIVLIAFGALFALWYKGGYESSKAFYDINTGKQAENVATLFYRGIKIPGTPFALFKRYYRFILIDRALGRINTVQYEKPGYNPFFIFYESGTIAGYGYCLVEKYEDQILPNLEDVKEGEFYDPQGKLVSSVKNGTGIIAVFCIDGQKIWESYLEDFKRIRLRHWDKDGILKLDKEY